MERNGMAWHGITRHHHNAIIQSHIAHSSSTRPFPQPSLESLHPRPLPYPTLPCPSLTLQDYPTIPTAVSTAVVTVGRAGGRVAVAVATATASLTHIFLQKGRQKSFVPSSPLPASSIAYPPALPSSPASAHFSVIICLSVRPSLSQRVLHQ